MSSPGVFRISHGRLVLRIAFTTYVRDGPLENLWGVGTKYQKIFAQRKIK